MRKSNTNCYFRTKTRPKIGDIIQMAIRGQGVITSLQDDDMTFTFINTSTGELFDNNWICETDLIERPKILTEVIFRHYNQEIIALFPAIAADHNINHCSSYMKIGQHGAASVDLVSKSSPALLSDKETSDLFLELTRVGYFLKVVTRFTKQHRIKRALQLV